MKCEIIRDLFPSYIDGLTSEESNHEIETHLETCEKCSTCLEEMKHDLSAPKVEMQDKVYMQFLKKIRKIEFERIVLVVSIVLMLVVMIFDWIDDYNYGIQSALHDELNMYVKCIDNKRILFFEPKDDQWLVTIGYSHHDDESENVKDNNKTPLFVLSPLKARKFDNDIIRTQGYEIPGVSYNRFIIEFIDENTYIETPDFYNGNSQYVDFEEDDFIEIQFGIEKKVIKLSDLYDGNIESLK